MTDIALDQIVELAFKLSIAEQATLLELVAAHLAHQVDESKINSEEYSDWTDEELEELLKPSSPKTGSEIAAMLESGEFDASAWSEMINPHITDPVEWLKALRRDASRKRNLNWGDE